MLKDCQVGYALKPQTKYMLHTLKVVGSLMVLQFLEGKRKWVQWLQVAIIGRDDLAHQLIGKDLKMLKSKVK